MAGYPGRQGRKPKASTIIDRQRDELVSDERPKRMPPAPSHLTDDEKKEWRRIGRQLLEAGLITRMDTDVLAAYCKAYVRWVEAEASVRKFGTIIKSPNGFPMQSPYLAVANKAMEQMRSLMSELGLTPASRVRIPRLKEPQATRNESRPRQSQSAGDPRSVLRAVK